ncbi:hypothetical protein PAPYR_4453 [Paratrimastix pyriformis]|uniref:Uncharacterized protein n=1 Tax=Paratrimastix pyriformis TaxID=342808 RepID=A0ABQ8UN19_9EUKA|nr:hypothetical protein PAPYR_4453 [Paratrimastix pyriformis]
MTAPKCAQNSPTPSQIIKSRKTFMMLDDSQEFWGLCKLDKTFTRSSNPRSSADFPDFCRLFQVFRVCRLFGARTVCDKHALFSFTRLFPTNPSISCYFNSRRPLSPNFANFETFWTFLEFQNFANFANFANFGNLRRTFGELVDFGDPSRLAGLSRDLGNGKLPLTFRNDVPNWRVAKVVPTRMDLGQVFNCGKLHGLAANSRIFPFPFGFRLVRMRRKLDPKTRELSNAQQKIRSLTERLKARSESLDKVRRANSALTRKLSTRGTSDGSLPIESAELLSGPGTRGLGAIPPPPPSVAPSHPSLPRMYVPPFKVPQSARAAPSEPSPTAEDDEDLLVAAARALGPSHWASQLQSDLEETRIRANSLDEELRRANQRLGLLEQKNRSLGERNAALEAERTRLREELERLRRDQSQADKQLRDREQMGAELRACRRDLADATMALRRATGERDQAMRQLREARHPVVRPEDDGHPHVLESQAHLNDILQSEVRRPSAPATPPGGLLPAGDIALRAVAVGCLAGTAPQVAALKEQLRTANESLETVERDNARLHEELSEAEERLRAELARREEASHQSTRPSTPRSLPVCPRRGRPSASAQEAHARLLEDVVRLNERLHQRDAELAALRHQLRLAQAGGLRPPLLRLSLDDPLAPPGVPRARPGLLERLEAAAYGSRAAEENAPQGASAGPSFWGEAPGQPAAANPQCGPGRAHPDLRAHLPPPRGHSPSPDTVPDPSGISPRSGPGAAQTQAVPQHLQHHHHHHHHHPPEEEALRFAPDACWTCAACGRPAVPPGSSGSEAPGTARSGTGSTRPAPPQRAPPPPPPCATAPPELPLPLGARALSHTPHRPTWAPAPTQPTQRPEAAPPAPLWPQPQQPQRAPAPPIERAPAGAGEEPPVGEDFLRILLGDGARSAGPSPSLGPPQQPPPAPLQPPASPPQQAAPAPAPQPQPLSGGGRGAFTEGLAPPAAPRPQPPPSPSSPLPLAPVLAPLPPLPIPAGLPPDAQAALAPAPGPATAAAPASSSEGPGRPLPAMDQAAIAAAAADAVASSLLACLPPLSAHSQAGWSAAPPAVLPPAPTMPLPVAPATTGAPGPGRAAATVTPLAAGRPLPAPTLPAGVEDEFSASWYGPFSAALRAMVVPSLSASLSSALAGALPPALPQQPRPEGPPPPPVPMPAWLLSGLSQAEPSRPVLTITSSPAPAPLAGLAGAPAGVARPATPPPSARRGPGAMGSPSATPLAGPPQLTDPAVRGLVLPEPPEAPPGRLEFAVRGADIPPMPPMPPTPPARRHGPPQTPPPALSGGGLPHSPQKGQPTLRAGPPLGSYAEQFAKRGKATPLARPHRPPPETPALATAARPAPTLQPVVEQQQEGASQHSRAGRHPLATSSPPASPQDHPASTASLASPPQTPPASTPAATATGSPTTDDEEDHWKAVLTGLTKDLSLEEEEDRPEAIPDPDGGPGVAQTRG